MQLSRLVTAAALGLLATGCAVTPYQNQKYTSNTIPFDGMAISESANIIIEAYNWRTSTYEWRGTTVSAATPTLNEGTFCSNSPAFYRYKLDIALNSNHWKLSGKSSIAKLRATQLKNGTSQPLYFTDNADGAYCMTQKTTTPGCDFYDVAYNQCHFNQNEVTIKK